MKTNDSDILTAEQIQGGLKDKRLYRVAEATGLSYPTVKKLAEGKELNYTIDTLKAISRYIKECPNSRWMCVATH